MDYGGAYGGQPWHGAQPSYRAQPSHEGPRRPAGRPGPRGRAGRPAAVLALVFGIAGLAVSLAGVVAQVLQRQIADWEAAKRWRLLAAGTIFPASVGYSPPIALDATALTLTARRIGIARQASCAAAADAAVAAALDRNGCE